MKKVGNRTLSWSVSPGPVPPAGILYLLTSGLFRHPGWRYPSGNLDMRPEPVQLPAPPAWSPPFVALLPESCPAAKPATREVLKEVRRADGRLGCRPRVWTGQCRIAGVDQYISVHARYPGPPESVQLGTYRHRVGRHPGWRSLPRRGLRNPGFPRDGGRSRPPRHRPTGYRACQ